MNSEEPLAGADAAKERNWDSTKVGVVVESLLAEAADDEETARLLAAGDKIHASPISFVGLRMDNSCLRIAMGLRLGTSIYAPHICQHCGAEVFALGLHGFSCRSSEGQHMRHSALNDIIHRSLSAAGIPLRLEPPGLLQSDGQRPDGMTLVPWGQVVP